MDTKLRVAVLTVGCRSNQSDSEWLVRALDRDRFEVVDVSSPADVTIVNSCAVTQAAVHDVARAVHGVRRTSSEGARVLLTGCLVGADPDEVRRLNREFWRAVPSWERDQIPAILERLREELAGDEDDHDHVHDHVHDHDHDHGNDHDHDYEGLRAAKLLRARPNLRVQDGCEHRCAYCAVPAGRGPERSMPPEQVLARIGRLASHGACEVVVCGINLGRWGRDLVPAQRLSNLVSMLDSRAPVDRIRLASIEPWIVDRDFIDAFASAHRIAPHVHLPIQSGDDGVLRAMRRPYTVEWFVETVSRLIAARPGLSLGTDVIAGFPGESDAAFERTLAVIRDLPVTYVHAFGFSPRPGTPAASMPDQVPSAEIGRRVREVMRIGLGKRVDFARSLVGDVVHPVFALRQRRAGTLVGVAGRYITVVTEGPATLAGRLAAVRVEGFDEHGRVLGCLIEHG